MWNKLYSGVITILFCLMCYHTVVYYKRANKAEHLLRNSKAEFLELDSIVSVMKNKSGEQVSTFLPLNFAGLPVKEESFLEDQVTELLDSINKLIETPKKSKPSSYTTTEFESEVTGKAIVKDSLATLEKDNWSISYNYRDSIFNGRYIGRFHDLVYYEPKKFLGITYGKGNLLSSKWLSDVGSSVTSSQSIHNLDYRHPTRFNIESETRFRFQDNSISTGGNILYKVGPAKIGGAVFYNLFTKEIEPEIKIRFGIVD